MRVPAAIAALSLRFIQEPLTLYRARAGRRVQSGRWAAGGFDEVQTVGVVVPQGEIRETLPGGLRARAVQDFYLRGKHAVRPIVEGQSGGDAIRSQGPHLSSNCRVAMEEFHSGDRHRANHTGSPRAELDAVATALRGTEVWTEHQRRGRREGAATLGRFGASVPVAFARS